MNNPKVFFRVHAVQRMFERNVSVKHVAQTIRSGTVVEDYSSEMPEPSRLLLGSHGKRPLHVVTSESAKTSETIIITVYRPDPDKWKRDFTSRRL